MKLVRDEQFYLSIKSIVFQSCLHKTWEKIHELEKSEIFCQALGIDLGDELTCEIGGKSARTRLKSASEIFR